MGRRPKTAGVMFECDACGRLAPRKRSDQRYCSKRKCQLRSKNGPLRPKPDVHCPYCDRIVKGRNTRQVTCLSSRCKRAHEAYNRNKNRPKMRTGETFKCHYCPRVVARIQSNQVTCGSDACRKARKQDRDNETFWMNRRRIPKVCGVCERPIGVKRFRYHPSCRKQLANDKKRLRRKLAKLTAEKIKVHRNKKPPQRQSSVRMEELKCESRLRRTS